MQTNHYPIIGRKAPHACSSFGDTANPHAQITCPSCRARLQAKIDAHRTMATSANAQEAMFFAKDAEAWSKVLAA